jgi:hypothetical protein
LVTIGTALEGQTEIFYFVNEFGNFIATYTAKWNKNRPFRERIGSGETVDENFLSRKLPLLQIEQSKLFTSFVKKHFFPPSPTG